MFRQKAPYLARQLAFWMLFFAAFRTLFIVFNYTKSEDGQLLESLLSFVYATRLDFATACILSAIPFLLWILQQFFQLKALHVINRIINILLIVILSLLSVANIKIYNEWGTQVTARALGYVRYPLEILMYIRTGELLLLLTLLVVVIYLLLKMYFLFTDNFSTPVSSLQKKLVYIVLGLALIVVGARGGLQLAPVNESSSYYSSLPFNNHAATNNIWFLMHSIENSMKTKNIYSFLPDEEAQEIKNKLFKNTTGSGVQLLKNNRPNVVFIILESWTADIIQALGGEKGVTPHFDELRKEGVLFTQMYSSGFRTEQGLISIFSGFPAQPNHSIITSPDKAEHLPSLNIDLKKAGYFVSFFYGGEVEFANMKSYLLSTRVDEIIDKHSFDKSQLNSKWGAHDEYVLSKQLEYLKNAPQPFFSTVLTLSTHEPFEVTMQTPFNGKKVEEKFKQAAYYTDYCLYSYFKEAKKQPWYNNTLFVLVADHGHHYPLNRNMNAPESHRITALLQGGAIADNFKGTTIDRICNQHDLPAILLSQMNISSFIRYRWSKNILNNETNEFAYYANENALGWITPQQNIIYSLAQNKLEEIQPKTEVKPNDTIIRQAKAFLQTLNNQYLNY